MITDRERGQNNIGLLIDRQSTEEGRALMSNKTPKDGERLDHMGAKSNKSGVVNHPFNIGGSTRLSDYVHTQRVNEVTVTMDSKSKSKPGSIDAVQDPVREKPMTQVAGSITIKRNPASRDGSGSP